MAVLDGAVHFISHTHNICSTKARYCAHIQAKLSRFTSSNVKISMPLNSYLCESETEDPRRAEGSSIPCPFQ